MIPNKLTRSQSRAPDNLLLKICYRSVACLNL